MEKGGLWGLGPGAYPFVNLKFEKMEKLSKKDLKRLSEVYAGSVVANITVGLDWLGPRQREYVQSQVKQIACALLGGYPKCDGEREISMAIINRASNQHRKKKEQQNGKKWKLARKTKGLWQLSR